MDVTGGIFEVEASNNFDKLESLQKFNHQNLLLSLNNAMAMQDIHAIEFSHKFNDHNLRLMDTKEQLRQNLAAVAVNKVHRLALSIASLRHKMGQYDAALTSIHESIKIAQNKNDHETVLDCTVWLYQILESMSSSIKGKEQQRQLLEHMIS